MTISINSNHAVRSLTSEQVSGWKQDVQSFFTEDWSRLRPLLMELEEKSWNTDSTIQLIQTPAQRRPMNTESATVSERPDLPHNGSATDPELRPPANDRLSALAAQIERRLQSARPVGK